MKSSVTRPRLYQRWFVCGTALALSLSVTNARAEIIPVTDMLRGIVISQAQCAALEEAVWITSMGQDFCMRSYVSIAGGLGSRPVVFLQGDQFGVLNLKTNTFSPPPTTKDTDTDRLIKVANWFSKTAKMRSIYLARIGVDGSSG